MNPLPTSKLTYSGRMVDLLRPDPEQIELIDIAHALARITRFTGHGDQCFKVAQHSVMVHDLARVPWALLHDAAEAYIGDVSSPLKVAMRCYSQGRCSDFDLIESRWQNAISLRFGLPIVDVHAADRQALLDEANANGPHSCAAFTWPFVHHDLRCVDVWPTELAEFNFLLRAKASGFK
jgi:uncharacterized protein